MKFLPDNVTLEEYLSAIYNEDAKHKCIISFNGVELENSDIYLEKLEFTSNLIDTTSKIFSLDNFISRTVEMTIHDIDENIIKDKVEIRIGTYINDNVEYVYVPMGIFNIQEIKTNDKKTYNITLRDNAVLFDKTYNAQIVIESNGGKATKRQILDDICKTFGVGSNIASFLGENDEVGVYDNTINARTYISYLAEQAGQIAYIDREGILKFADLQGDENEITDENIAITNALERNVNKLIVYGKCEQETRTSKNVFDKNLFSTFTDSLQYINLTLTPNTQYTMSSNIPLSTSGNGNLFFYNYGSQPRTGINDVTTNKSRTLTTDNTGEITVAYRDSNGTLDDEKNTYFYQIELGETATSYEQYGTMPSPNLPSEIKTVDGIKNLFNKNTVTLNNYITLSGSYNTQDGIDTSDYIKVTPNEKYIIGNRGDWTSVALYDINKTFIQRPSIGKGELIYTVDDNTYYIRIIFPHEYLDTLKVEKGTVTHDYVPYGNWLPIVKTGKNYLENILTTRTVNGVTFTVNEDKTIKVNGTATAQIVLTLTNNINMSGKYILSGCPEGGSSTTYELQLYGTGNTVDYGNNKAISNNPNGIIRLVIRNGAVCDNLIFKPMIRNESIEDSTYEKYIKETTLIDLKENELCSIGDTKDELIIKNGKTYINKKIGKYIVQNGTFYSGSSWKGYYLTLSDKTKDTDNGGLICNKAKFNTSRTDGTVYENENNVMFVGTTTDTIDSLKLKYDGSIIYYVLATPQKIELDNVNITLNNGINNINLESNINTEIMINYYSKKIPYNIPIHYVSKYDSNTSYKISAVSFETGQIKYEKTNDIEENENGILYLNSSNPYINSQEQINNIFNLTNGFKIDSFNIEKILGNPIIEQFDLIKTSDYNEIEDKTYTFITLGQNKLIYNGKLSQNFDTQISKEKRETNVTLNGEENFKKTIKTEVNNINATLNTTVELVDKNQEQIAQTITSINNIQNLFQITGGSNLIKNSVGLFKDENWIKSETGQFEFGEVTSLVGYTTSSSRIKIKNGTLTSSSDNISGISTSQIKSLSFKIQQDEDVTTTIKLYGSSEELPLYKKTFEGKYDLQEIYDEVENKFLADNINLTLKIETESEYEGSFMITDLMLNDGEKMTWQPASGEIWGTVIKMSQLGISCYSRDGGYVTLMTSQGLQVRELHGEEIGNIITYFTNLGISTGDITQTGIHVQKKLVHTTMNVGNKEIYVEYIRSDE